MTRPARPVPRSGLLAALLVLAALAAPPFLPPLASADAPGECFDGVDNDGDGATDWPSDINCESPLDESEAGGLVACWDGIDNDGDGHRDFPRDLQCTSPYDNDESA